MGWDIEVTRNGFAFFYDRTAGRVFGPLFSSEKEANAFAAYLDQDARNYAPRNEKMAEKLEELDRLYSSFQEAVDVDWEEGSVNYELELDALEKMLGEAVAARGANVKLALKDQLALVLSWLPTPGTRVPPAPSAAEASLWADLGGMKLALEASALTLEETRKTLNETQKYLDEARSELEAANTEIGRLRNELSGCPMGRYCDLHEARHGREAEELRERFEYLASEWEDWKPKRSREIRDVLATVDARDSAGYVEGIGPDQLAAKRKTSEAIRTLFRKIPKTVAADLFLKACEERIAAARVELEVELEALREKQVCEGALPPEAPETDTDEPDVYDGHRDSARCPSSFGCQVCAKKEPIPRGSFGASSVETIRLSEDEARKPLVVNIRNESETNASPKGVVEVWPSPADMPAIKAALGVDVLYENLQTTAQELRRAVEALFRDAGVEFDNESGLARQTGAAPDPSRFVDAGERVRASLRAFSKAAGDLILFAQNASLQ
jgi:hypothetical protein